MVSVLFTVPQYLPLGEGRTYYCWMPYLPTNHYYLCSLMVSVSFTVPQYLPLGEGRTYYCWMPYLPTNHYYLCSLMVSVSFTVPQYLPLGEGRTYYCWMPYLPTNHYYLCSLMVSFTFIHCTSILAIRRGQDLLLLDALSTNKPLLSMFIDGILHFHSLYLNTYHYREQDLLLLDALSTNKPLLSMFIDGICFIHCFTIHARRIYWRSVAEFSTVVAMSLCWLVALSHLTQLLRHRVFDVTHLCCDWLLLLAHIMTAVSIFHP